MRVPIRYLRGNLLWSTSGVWAIWRVSPVSYAHAPLRARMELHASVTGIIKRLTGEPILLSLCAQSDAADVVERMINGVDLDECPGWVEVADTALDWLGELELGERTHWMIVPLPADRRLGWRSITGSAMTSLSDGLGLAPPSVSASEVDMCETKARRLATQLAGGPVLTAATPAEVLWIYAHSLRRGLTEPLLADVTGGGARFVNGRLRGPSLAALDEVRLTEGGSGEPTGSSLRRRWLQVELEQGIAYQAFLALAEMPTSFGFPGSEIFSHLDDFSFPIDYCSRLKIVSGSEAEARSRRKARELVAQVDEYDADTAGIPQALADAAQDLDDERARLQASATEVEVQSATILCVWGQTPEECESRAYAVSGTLGTAEYQVVRPTGGQRALFGAMLPGTPVPAVLREFTQFQLASDYAMAMPWTCADVGDPTGTLLGLSLDGGSSRPVLLDLANAPKQDASASLGAVGELGAGKSVLLKSIQIGLLDRGGQVIAVDRTPMGEWATFAEQAAPDAHQIIRAGPAANLCVDPLRVFPAGIAARYAKSYLTLQLGVVPMSPQGLVLAQAVDRAAASDHPRMRGVISELETVARDEHGTRRAEHAGELADLLEVIAADQLGQMVFGDLPPLRLDGDFVVFHTAGLTLPSREVAASDYQIARQPLEALIGRATLYVIAAISREVAFSDPSRFTCVAFDECYWLTSSDDGQALVLEIVRDGRKHAAGALLGSHDPGDFGSDIICGLLSNRFLLRHRDSGLASQGLEFLGMDADDQQLIDFVNNDLSPVKDAERKGEALFRDARGRVGRVKVVIPPVGRIASSILTTPGS